MKPTFPALLFLTACGSINPLTAARLSQLDPLTSDPADLAAQVTLPPDIAIPTGGMEMYFGATRDGQEKSATVQLDQHGDIWRLSPEDVIRLETLQREIGIWKAEDPDGTEGTLSISIAGCSLTGTPDPQGEIAVRLSFDGGAQFRPFLTGLTVADMMQQIGAGETLDPCNGL
ncbi:hypothetical protein [Thalassobius sp. MITS945101]|uniref:hypothetical protein n=1 Tax=Thalassobius sp. MITS945101 TaxID=3096994 RepID=UPI00399B218B